MGTESPMPYDGHSSCSLYNDMEDATACYLYTSGSTGDPKRVGITHGAILERLRWQWQLLPQRRDEEVRASQGIFTRTCTWEKIV